MWRLGFGVAVGVAFVVAATAVVLAALLASQGTTATLSMATTDDINLYICEPSGETGNPDCPGDDSGPNEIIFEADENFAPGGVRLWDIRLRNVGSQLAWDVWSFDVTFTPVDPNEDCGVPPELQSVRVLGTDGPGYVDPVTGKTYNDYNDNHPWHTFPVPGSIALYSEFGNSMFVVHVAPGGYEDLRLRVAVPEAGQGEECMGSEWQLNVQWNVAADD